MERRRRLVAVIGGIGLAIGIMVGPALAADHDVAISGFSFSPRTVTVRVGDTVTWTNSDAQAHTATSGTAWTTQDISGGDSATITFQTAGTFDYICAIHPTMTGQVVVRAAGGSVPPTDTAAPSDTDDATGLTLALLGMVMLVGTIAADRLVRTRRSAG